MVRALTLLFALCLAAPAMATSPVPLLEDEWNSLFPVWTPDGQTILFESQRNGVIRIYRMPAAGGTPVQLTFGPNAMDRFPAVSPDGTRFIYSRLEANGVGSVYAMPIGGGVPTQVSQPAHPDDANWHPVWSPDGSTIYTIHRSGFDGSYWHLYRLNASGGIPELVYDYRKTLSQPRPSPDGTAVLVSMKSGSRWEGWEIQLADPANPIQVTFGNTPVEDYHPAGGRFLCDDRTESENGWTEVHEVDRATLVHTRLTYDSVGNPRSPEHLPRYSPDGTRLVYSARLGSNTDWDLYLLQLEDPVDPQTGLAVGTASGLPDQQAIHLPVSLTNGSPVRGLDVRLQGVPDHLDYKGVAGVGRAASFETSWHQTGSELRILMYSTGGAVLHAGSGEVMRIALGIDAGATLGTEIQVQVQEALASDVLGATGPIDATDGLVRVERRQGDITGDNLVDAGDLVRLVELILGKGAPAAPDETSAADCDESGSLNVGDVTCEVDLILGEPYSPDLSAPTRPYSLVSDTEIRGLDIRTREPRTPIHLVNLGSLQLHSGAGRHLAYDPAGNGLAPGSGHFRIAAPGEDVELRAYGPGGKRLAVAWTGSGWKVSDRFVPGPMRLLAAMPNPFRSSATVRFDMPEPGPVRLDAYDLRGARVAGFTTEPLPAGVNDIVWRTDHTGERALAAGVYFLRLTHEASGSTASVRVTHLGT